MPSTCCRHPACLTRTEDVKYSFDSSKICVSCRLASGIPMHAHLFLTQPCFRHGGVGAHMQYHSSVPPPGSYPRRPVGLLEFGLLVSTQVQYY